MDFLGAVNRVLVNNLIILGDDDLLTSFSGTQHVATTRLARNALQTELNNLNSFFDMDYEKTQGSITTEAATRTYTLPSDFVRFFADDPYLVNASDDNDRLYEYKGGENKLRRNDFTYLTNPGVENWWYWNKSSVKSIALYQVPDGVRTYNFDYERDVSINLSTDTIPLHTESEAQAFVDMASRRFKFMLEGLNVSDIEKDADYVFNRSTLMNLIAIQNPRKRYGKTYR